MKYLKIIGDVLAIEFKEFIMGVSTLYMAFVMFLLATNIATIIVLLRIADAPNRACNLLVASVFALNWAGILVCCFRRRKEYLEMKNIKVEPMYAVCEVCGGKTSSVFVYEAPDPNSEYGKYWGDHETLCMCEKCKHKYFDGCHEDWTEPQKKNWLHAQTKELFEAVHARDKILRESSRLVTVKKEGDV